MKTATVRDLRNNFAKVSRWLKDGEKVEIKKRGVPIGLITPTAPVANGEHPVKRRFNAKARLKRLKEIYGDKVLPDNIVLTMREEKDW